MTVWPDEFANRYDEWSAHMTEDVRFYLALARDADGPVVELAVGNGRVAVAVALATGRRVIGIDVSSPMLEQARVKAARAGVQLDLREGDMRDFELAEPAGLVYCPFRALLHLPTWADRRRTFERVAASLRPAPARARVPRDPSARRARAARARPAGRAADGAVGRRRRASRACDRRAGCPVRRRSRRASRR